LEITENGGKGKNYNEIPGRNLRHSSLKKAAKLPLAKITVRKVPTEPRHQLAMGSEEAAQRRRAFTSP
jgi:hypothetical protein